MAPTSPTALDVIGCLSLTCTEQVESLRAVGWATRLYAEQGHATEWCDPRDSRRPRFSPEEPDTAVKHALLNHDPRICCWRTLRLPARAKRCRSRVCRSGSMASQRAAERHAGKLASAPNVPSGDYWRMVWSKAPVRQGAPRPSSAIHRTVRQSREQSARSSHWGRICSPQIARASLSGQCECSVRSGRLQWWDAARGANQERKQSGVVR